jgi:hypothetical protein
MFEMEAQKKMKPSWNSRRGTALVEQSSWNEFPLEIGPQKWSIFSTSVLKRLDIMDRR